MWAYMSPVEMEDTLLQTREGLIQEVVGLLCQERVDPGVKGSGSLQWLPTFSLLAPVGHLMGMDDPRSNRAEVEGWKRKGIPLRESYRMQCHLMTVGAHMPEGQAGSTGAITGHIRAINSENQDREE